MHRKGRINLQIPLIPHPELLIKNADDSYLPKNYYMQILLQIPSAFLTHPGQPISLHRLHRIPLAVVHYSSGEHFFVATATLAGL
jgi:hypothetical protein